MKAKSTYRLDGNFSAQLASISYECSFYFTPVFNIRSRFVDFDFVLPCAK